MAETHVVSALTAKRAELAGELETVERQALALRTALGHLDATLRLFDPDARPEMLPSKRRRARDPYFAPGERSRLVLDTLRKAGEPLSTREVTLRVMAAKGLNGSDVVLVEKGVWRCLQGYAGRLVPDEALTGLEHGAGRHRLQAVEVGQAIGIGLVGPGEPEALDPLLERRFLDQARWLDAAADGVGSEAR